MGRKWKIAGLLILSVTLLSGLIAAWNVLPFTPRGAARVNSQCIPVLPHRRFSTITRTPASGTLVFVSERCLHDGREYLAQWRVAYERPLWRGQEGGWQRVGPPSPGAAIQYAAAGQVAAGQSQAVVFGRVLAPAVAQVEVRFDTGQVLRDAPEAGMFAIIGAAKGACELRALDAQGQVVQQISLASPMALPPLPPGDVNWGGNHASAADCAPKP